jgi:hypothetical protein
MNSNLYISNTASINHLSVFGNQEINGNLVASGPFIQIGNSVNDNLIVNSKSQFIGDSSMGNVYCTNTNILGNLYTSHIISNTNTFDISASFITIGSKDAIINIQGSVNQALTSNSTRAYLNTGTNNPNNATDAGIYIYEKNNNSAAFFATSKDRNQIKFKAPASTNIVSIGISDLSLNLATNNNGILILKTFTDTTETESLEAITHQINVSTFDISNILQRSMIESTSTNQVISTNMNIKGNLIINNSKTSTTAALDISGNLFHSNGWITQF